MIWLYSRTSKLHDFQFICSANPLSIQRRRRKAAGFTDFKQRQFIGFPFTSLADALELDDGQRQEDVEALMETIRTCVLEERVLRIQEVVAQRSYTVLPIVENLYDMGNLSAVLRLADAFGFGAVHSISTDDDYKQSTRTSGGAVKWMDVRVWQPSADDGEGATRRCLTAVKAAGYRVVVTHLRKGALDIRKIDWTRPTAFVLGNEKDGVSDEAIELADECAAIPMAGFVDSFNISVAASLIMYEARQQRASKLGKSGDLSEEQSKMLNAALMLRSTREGPTLIKELLRRPPQNWQAIDKFTWD